MNKKTAVLILMLAAAVIIIIASVSVSKTIRLKKNGVSVESLVLDSRTNSKSQLKTVSVTFKTTEGKEVTATGSTRQHLSGGDEVTIWYDKESPQKIVFGDTISYNMRGVIIGGLLFLFGLYYFVRFSRTDKANKRLIRSGVKIAAEFVSIERNEKFRMGDKNPWNIKCKWTDNNNNKVYYFISKDYTIDPSPYMAGRNSLDVYINPDDPARYYMDTSFMPKGNNTIG